MSTTFDPSKEASLHLLASPASVNGNGKADAKSLSQLAARGGFWNKSAPKALRKQRLAFDEALNLYWSERSRRPSVAELCDAEGSALEWALRGESVSSNTQGLIKLSTDRRASDDASLKVRRKRQHEVQTALSAWLDAGQGRRPDYDFALGCLAAAALLDQCGRELTPLLGWRLLEFLTATAQHAPTWNLGADAEAEDVIASQLLGVELPLSLAYFFGEMAPMSELVGPATGFLTDSTLELLNGQGLTRAAHLSALRPLVACWTRCRALAGEVKGARIPKKALRQLEWSIRQTLRWTAPDGTELLGESGEPWPGALLKAALVLGGTKKDAAAAGELVDGDVCKKLDTAKKGPEAAYDCEWSGLTVMRRGWSADAAVVAVDYSRAAMRLEVWAGRRKLLAGPVTTESQLNGRPLRATGSWENTCSFIDKDVNYLELSLPLQDGAKLDRQILLALRDEFVLVIDHLLSDEPGELEHAWQAPLGPGLLFCGEGETRDALLVDGEPLARLMPLALPEWRIDPRVGELSYAGGGVRLAERTMGRALACPLFIDLNAARAAQQCTWRQLTVAEQLQIMPSDAAVSYRIQSGEDQWVYYRSQGRRGNRTFLGQNTSSECYIARFKAPSGEVRELLEIEG